MERKPSVRFLLAVLLAVLVSALSSAAAESANAYYVIGEQLELRPSPVPSAITSVVWKFNGNMLVEWAKDAIPLEYYKPFKTRATLDQTTGVLRINDTTQADSGRFTVEINNNVQTVEHDAVHILRVPQPEADLKPLVCGHSSPSCTLHCKGNTEGAGPVEFFFRFDDKEQKHLGNKLEIQNNEKAQAVKMLSCKMKNPVSEKESAAISNKLFKEKVDDDSGSGGVVGGVVGTLVLAIVAAAGIGYWKREPIRKWWDGVRGGGGAGQPPKGPQPPASKTEEDVPLNTNGTPSADPPADSV